MGECDPNNIERIKIIAYEPAYGIIGDPAKKNPTTRQSADHSMAYIISSMLRKAFEKYEHITEGRDEEELWKFLMLLPNDYSYKALYNEVTRGLMAKIDFEHGGKEYDALYPKGIPTREVFDSGLV